MLNLNLSLNLNPMFLKLVYPILAMVLLTIIAWLRMYYIRFSEVKKNNINIEDLHIFNRELPKKIITSGDNFRNLFEVPVLFYTFILLLLCLNITSEFYVIFSWIFVGMRYIHSFIHSTYNKILHRFLAYFISCIVLWSMWIKLFLDILN